MLIAFPRNCYLDTMRDYQMSMSGNRTIRLFHLTMTSVPKNICKVKGFIFVMQMLTKLK